MICKHVGINISLENITFWEIIKNFCYYFCGYREEQQRVHVRQQQQQQQ